MMFSIILAISPPIPIRFGRSRAHFVGDGYRNLYPYPYPHLPYPQPVTITTTNFSPISPGEQCLVLLMCALVGCSPLVLLDEAWSGMDDEMIAAARQYLRGDFTVGTDGMAGIGEDQAIVVITHWEDEVMYCISKQSIFTLCKNLKLYCQKNRRTHTCHTMQWPTKTSC